MGQRTLNLWSLVKPQDEEAGSLSLSVDLGNTGLLQEQEINVKCIKSMTFGGIVTVVSLY